MHDFDLTVSPYNGHMLRNLSKYCLFICCKQSSSTHFCHFLTTAFVTDVLAGSNPMHRAQKRKASIAGGLTIRWWAMRDVRVRLAPPASASSLRSSRAALENASRFLSFAPCRVRIPLRWVQKRKAPIAGSLSNRWWAMRDVACGFAARFRFGPAALACCAGKRFAFPQLRTLAGSNPMRWAQKRKASITGGLTIQWWAMRDSNPQPCACKAPALTVAPIARRD